MLIIPVISKIIEHEGLFYCLTAADDTIFVTQEQEIANMYYAIPAVLERQAAIIRDLTEKLNVITEEYNSMVMGMLPSGSRFVH